MRGGLNPIIKKTTFPLIENVVFLCQATRNDYNKEKEYKL